MAKVKAVNTKILQSSMADFVKLYNLELTDKEAIGAKQNIEKSLIIKIKDEIEKYEH